MREKERRMELVKFLTWLFNNRKLFTPKNPYRAYIIVETYLQEVFLEELACSTKD